MQFAWPQHSNRILHPLFHNSNTVPLTETCDMSNTDDESSTSTPTDSEARITTLEDGQGEGMVSSMYNVCTQALYNK